MNKNKMIKKRTDLMISKIVLRILKLIEYYFNICSKLELGKVFSFFQEFKVFDW